MRFGLHSGQHLTTFSDLRALWTRAADAGFDACYLFDHFRPLFSSQRSFVPEEADRPDGACLEAFTTLAALAGSVPRVSVGVMVAGAGYRAPAMLVHQAATLAEAAPGRLEIGVGAGWFEREYREYGYRFSPPGDRLDALEASLSLLRDRLGGRVRLWTAGPGERRTIPMAARLADAWNVMSLSPAEFAAKCRILDVAAREAGRDPSSIERSIALRVFCDRDGATARGALEALARSRGVDPAWLAERSMAGTPSECAAGLRRYGEAGATHVAIMVHPPYDLAGLDLIGSEVLGAVVSPA